MTFKYRPGDPALFSDGEEVGRIFNEAVREALLDHKRAGNPIAVSGKDGKVVIIPPEEIPVEDPLVKKPARRKTKRRLARPRRTARASRLARPRRARA